MGILSNVNKSSPPLDEASILLIEDDDLSRKTFSNYLKRCNFHVVEAINGREGLERLSEGCFDLVLLDMNMPVLDGREVLKVMSRDFNNIPRIVLTAHDNESDVLLALKTGAYDYIIKPVMDLNLLRYSVERGLERKFLQEEREKTTLQMAQVNKIISMLNRGLDFEEIFSMLSESLREILYFESIAILDFSHQDKSLSVKLIHSNCCKRVTPGISFDLSDEYADELSSRKYSLLIDDTRSYAVKVKAPNNVESQLLQGHHSIISTPLIIDNVVRGFLILASSKVGVYTQDNLGFLSLIAGQVALSLQRGELLSDLSMHTKHLERMIKIRTHEVTKIQKTTIFALSKLAEIRDSDTGEHLERMRNYSVLLAQMLKYSGDFEDVDNDFLKNIYDSSILHDIGKVGIPDSILLKPGPLTPREFEKMKEHSTIGYKALDQAYQGLEHDDFLTMSKNIALYHHERWDGKGYPTGLSQEKIPLSARIVTIGDIYDALTTYRPYKEAFSHDKAVDIMKSESERFDPRILKVFLENHMEFDKIRQQFS